MTPIIAYYRVSTKRQGDTGHGLDAQRAAVKRFVDANPAENKIIAEFTEVESGTKNDRPELEKALAQCRMTHARLVVAKLDRLARNASFLHRLREAGIEFVACDMPSANKMVLGIMAEIAEAEVDMIRKRTKEGIAAAKAKGVKWGTAGALRTPEHIASMVEKSAATRRAQSEAKLVDLVPLVKKLYAELGTYEAVAARLNEMHIKTLSGRGMWDRIKVLRIHNYKAEVYDV